MATFSVHNFGCRATEADASALRRDMVSQGLKPAASEPCADIVILNTCTVTAAADLQARETIRRIHRDNPSARIIVTGCYAQRAPQEIAELEGVSAVVDNSRQSEIGRLVRELRIANPNSAAQRDFVPLGDVAGQERGSKPVKILSGDILARNIAPLLAAPPLAGDRTRPILKIQDGCNNRCSYCVIPFVRGRSRSLAPDAVVKAGDELVAAGAKEIVLSGINLGSYGRDLTPRADLITVVRRLLAETAVEQLRFSSIEPQDVTQELADLVASTARIARHFHVPLQSGSDRVLFAMHRWYRTAHYEERIKLIRRMLPDAAIGADVIVGFPGELEEDFQATAEFIERLPLTYLHVFSFSERPGTEAVSRDSRVAQPVIHQRASVLREVNRKKAGAFRRLQAGRELRALTLNRRGNGWTEAITGNYLKVRVAGAHAANAWRRIDFQDAAEGAVCASEPVAD